MIDKRNLTVDQQAQIEQWQNGHDQLQKLEDVAALAAEMVKLLGAGNDDTKKQNTNLGALMLDMREALNALKEKEAPEFPDFAKPMVEQVKKLEATFVKAFAGVDFKPEFKPNIEVKPADVQVRDVDLKPLEKILKQDVPAAFEEAVQGIKFPALPDDQEFKNEVIEWLDSINKGVHQYPQAPTQVKVTNPDGSYIGQETTMTARYDYSSSTLIYTATATIGTSEGSTGWIITKYDLASAAAASGKIATNVSWTNRALGSYA